MARKKRNSIADFDSVANTDDNVDNNINVNINVNDDNIIDDIIGSNSKKNEKVMAGIYFEKEVAKELDRIAKKGPRGTKSKIVNEAVKRLLEDQNR